MAISVYQGSCDASAAVRIGADSEFVTASDEDYILRVYDSRQPGLPSLSFDLTTFLEPDDATKGPDIEGAARIGDCGYWITSHGRDWPQRPTDICSSASGTLSPTGGL